MSYINEVYVYEATRELIGAIVQEETSVVHMKRERFVEIVEETLIDIDDSDKIKDLVIPIAQTMPRYPMGAWIHPVRGCGCIVGEYLVREKIIQRWEFMQSSGYDYRDADDILRGQPNGGILYKFGNEVDQYLRKEIGYGVEAIIIDG